MTDTFDPYRKWLGIRDPERPPNHYRLLGIELFEDDPDVISAAADRQMGHIRRYQVGEHSEASQQILNEIAAAKICLLREDKKHAYDQRLRDARKETAGTPAKTLPVAQAVTTAPTSSPEMTRPVPPVAFDATPSRWWSGWAASTAALVVLIAAFIGYTVVDRMVRDRMASRQLELPGQPTATDASNPVQDAPPPTRANTDANAEALADDVGEVPAADGSDEPPNQESAADDEVVSIDGDASESSELDDAELLVNTSSAHSDPNPDEVTPVPAEGPRSLGVALGLYVGQHGTTPELGDGPLAPLSHAMRGRNFSRAEQLWTDSWNKSHDDTQQRMLAEFEPIYDQWTRFWDAVDEGVLRVAAGNELVYQGAPVTVEQLTLEQQSIVGLVLRTPSGTTHSVTVERSEIDLDLALSIVTSLADIAPGTAISMASAALATDREGDIATAERLVDVLRLQGRSALTLEPLHRYWGLVHSSRPQPTVPAADDSSDAVPEDAVTRERRPVPSPADLKPELAKIRAAYDAEYRGLSSSTQSADLARQLWQSALNTNGSTLSRFALLYESARLYESAGHAVGAIQVVTQTAQDFQIDRDQQYLNSLNEVSAHLEKTPEQFQQLLATTNELTKQAIREESYDFAERLVVFSIAQVTRDPSRTSAKEDLLTLRDLIEEMSKRKTQAESARKRLAESDDDASAHQSLGIYLCFVRDDWTAGLAHFRKCNNRSLREIADAELAVTSAPSAQKEIGDQWWELAHQRRGNSLERQGYLRRAIYWYEKVYDELSPVDRRLITQRIESLKSNSDDRHLDANSQVLIDNVWEFRWRSGNRWSPVRFQSNGEWSAASASGTKPRGRWEWRGDAFYLSRTDSRGYSLVMQVQDQQLKVTQNRNGSLNDTGVGTAQ
ncbi:MAG: hypothetical protein KDA60_11515 [Planctomycetales bacterium]|nr:hypothetical protein [Planctomycetales bacterium]